MDFLLNAATLFGGVAALVFLWDRFPVVGGVTFKPLSFERANSPTEGTQRHRDDLERLLTTTLCSLTGVAHGVIAAHRGNPDLLLGSFIVGILILITALGVFCLRMEMLGSALLACSAVYASNGFLAGAIWLFIESYAGEHYVLAATLVGALSSVVGGHLGWRGMK
ncbi:MAG: hypothetical protein K0U98_15000 [Deltaproteobacteria bacterium]|nr:hypothetical protein [Deltaproteobacteria bacterium]